MPDLKFTKSTDSEHEIKLTSHLVYATWTKGVAYGGQKARVEVGTAFVGNGAKIEIKGKSKDGAKLGKITGVIKNNRFLGELDIPEDIEIGDEVFFEVKLSKNGLSGESDRIPAQPAVRVSNMQWSAGEARRGDILTLSADVTGVKSGSEVLVKIYEYDRDGLHDPVVEFPATISSDKLECDWEYEYIEDTDEIPTDAEMQRYGRNYNPPEYFFTVRIGDQEYGREQESGLLTFKDWIQVTAARADGSPCADSEYKITLADGTRQEGRLDSNGQVRLEDMPPGRFRIFIQAFVEQE
jgi:hypothetical protein